MEQLLHCSWSDVCIRQKQCRPNVIYEKCEFRTFDYDRIYPVYFVTYYDRLSFTTMCGVLYPPIKPLQPKRWRDRRRHWPADGYDGLRDYNSTQSDDHSRELNALLLVFQFRLMMVVRLTIRQCCDHLCMQHCSDDSSAKQYIILSHLKLSIDGA